jgi:pyruvate/2-oxoglutarate dehydrogenase complex dihydrolipoamide acyltransferase (E2) component
MDDLMVELTNLLIDPLRPPDGGPTGNDPGTGLAVKAALPPSYVNTPVAIAYADVDDALIVTMTRILGLCWAYDYERTPALTAEQVAELPGRPRSTLYRHLKQLRDMEWLRIDRADRRMVIRPILAYVASLTTARPKATSLVARAARAASLDLATVAGPGFKGRIMRSDVETAISSAGPASVEVPVAAHQAVGRKSAIAVGMIEG